MTLGSWQMRKGFPHRPGLVAAAATGDAQTLILSSFSISTYFLALHDTLPLFHFSHFTPYFLRMGSGGRMRVYCAPVAENAPAPKASGRPTSKARSFRAAKVARARGDKSGARSKASRQRPFAEVENSRLREAQAYLRRHPSDAPIGPSDWSHPCTRSVSVPILRLNFGRVSGMTTSLASPGAGRSS